MKTREVLDDIIQVTNAFLNVHVVRAHQTAKAPQGHFLALDIVSSHKYRSPWAAPLEISTETMTGKEQHFNELVFNLTEFRDMDGEALERFRLAVNGGMSVPGMNPFENKPYSFMDVSEITGTSIMLAEQWVNRFSLTCNVLFDETVPLEIAILESVDAQFIEQPLET
jgi:hypothetical protein